MNLRYITFSDPDENTPIEKLIELLKISEKVELAVQAMASTMSVDMPKYNWFDKLIELSESQEKPLNISMHVNYNWCDGFFGGQLSNELLYWFYSTNKFTGEPTIKRWQLNIGDNTKKYINMSKIIKIIKNHPDHEFIFPYNKKPDVNNVLKKLNDANVEFSVLFNSSYGGGKLPDNWESPIYESHQHGYSGGISPENVYDNLNQIKNRVSDNYTTWVSARGKLVKPGTRQFDIERAHTYISNTLEWNRKNNKTK